MTTIAPTDPLDRLVAGVGTFEDALAGMRAGATVYRLARPERRLTLGPHPANGIPWILDENGQPAGLVWITHLLADDWTMAGA